MRDHPIVLIELGGTGNDPVEDLRVADIVQFLTTFGYRGFRSSGSKLIEITETKNLPYMNVIFKAV